MRWGEVHNSFKFKDGLNEDDRPFQTEYECCGGGFYFCEEKDVPQWIGLYHDVAYVREVTVPENTPLFKETNNKWKAPRIFLHPREPIGEWLVRRPALAIVALTVDGYTTLDLIPEHLRTPELCLAAVKHSGFTLGLTPETLRTVEMCTAAVSENGGALKYVPDELVTADMCLTALRKSRHAMFWIPSAMLTEDMCVTAVQAHGRCALSSIPDRLKTPKVLAAAAAVAALKSSYTCMRAYA